MALAKVTAQQKRDYFAKMYPAAVIASQATQGKLPPEWIVATWSYETHWGTNGSAKANNHGGIKANSLGRDYVAGQYAGYNSIETFAKDWARVLNLSYYTAVHQGSMDYTALTQRFNASPYMEQGYNVNTIVGRAKEVMTTIRGGVPNPGTGAGAGSGGGVAVGNYSDEQIKNIGLAAIALFTLLAVSR